MLERIYTDTLIVGGGIVGLALASEISKHDDTILVEKNYNLIEETSSRNSGVIHSGIYYPHESLKEKHSMQGNRMLYEHCKKFDISHKKCGKFIVASKDQLSELTNLINLCKSKDINYRSLSAKDMSKYQSLSFSEGIELESSGIVDVHNFADSLEFIARQNHCQISTRTELTSFAIKNNFFESLISCEGQEFIIESTNLIFSMGLSTSKFFEQPDLMFLKKHIPDNKFYIGHYYKSKNFDRFDKLIYPIPEKHSLGIHITFNTHDARHITFGPDAHEIDKPSYELNKFSTEHMESFYVAIEKYLPSIRNYSLEPDYVGIRPKIMENNGFNDFKILDQVSHGQENLFILHGIESPGLTSCLSIARSISDAIVKD
ncbi:FAD-dependent oxidoreductase [Gammaproteobacteria bacterium]|nr:FAD-dependent oxidoreductase [Gammaproteobacteria bacterium]